MYPELQIFEQADMRSPPEDAGLLAVLEPPTTVPRRKPALIADTAGLGRSVAAPAVHTLHGSYLVQRRDCLLFGQNHLVSPDGTWTCEERTHKRQYLSYLYAEFYDRMWPGARPQIDHTAPWLRLSTANLGEADIIRIEEPVFLATALEPPIWGRWIATVAPKALDFHEFGAGRKFLCYAALPWQQAFLALLGIGSDRLLQHDPGRTYICRDVMTVEYSTTDMILNRRDRACYHEIVASHRRPSQYGAKLFVSRMSRSRDNPYYRVLQNELALAGLLAEFGFDLIEPEYLSFQEQISAFAAAEQVVCVGGSGLYNAAFCAPGSTVVTVESSTTYTPAHTNLLSSLDLRHGVILGQEDPTDTGQWHRRWSLDIGEAAAALRKILG